jgi:hypothetical protein
MPEGYGLRAAVQVSNNEGVQCLLLAVVGVRQFS